MLKWGLYDIKFYVSSDKGLIMTQNNMYTEMDSGRRVVLFME